jgi:hypothetical protein
MNKKLTNEEIRELLESVLEASCRKDELQEGFVDQLKRVAKVGAVGALVALTSLKASAQNGKIPKGTEMGKTEVLRLAPRLQLKNNVIDISDQMQKWAPEQWEKFKKSPAFKKSKGKMNIYLDDFKKESGSWTRLPEEMQAAILNAVLERAIELGIRSTKMPKGGKIIAQYDYDFKTYKGVEELPRKQYRLRMVQAPKGKAGKSQEPDPEFIKAWNKAVEQGLDKFWYEKGGYWVVVKLAEGSDEEKGTIDLVNVGVELEEVPN